MQAHAEKKPSEKRFWSIAELAAWIETRDANEVDRSCDRIPASEAVDVLMVAAAENQIGEVTGEVDGTPRRVIKPVELSDYSIRVVTDDDALRMIFPYAQRLLGACVIVVRSKRLYPAALVNDRTGRFFVPLGTTRETRYRFIQGLLFERAAAQSHWSADDARDGGSKSDDGKRADARDGLKSGKSLGKARDYPLFVEVREQLEKIFRDTRQRTCTDADLRSMISKQLGGRSIPKRLFLDAKKKAVELTGATAWLSAGRMKKNLGNPEFSAP